MYLEGYSQMNDCMYNFSILSAVETVPKIIDSFENFNFFRLSVAGHFIFLNFVVRKR